MENVKMVKRRWPLSWAYQAALGQKSPDVSLSQCMWPGYIASDVQISFRFGTFDWYMITTEI
jgi:hypothetical protein